jgi:hypothetical protein
MSVVTKCLGDRSGLGRGNVSPDRFESVDTGFGLRWIWSPPFQGPIGFTDLNSSKSAKWFYYVETVL